MNLDWEPITDDDLTETEIALADQLATKSAEYNAGTAALTLYEDVTERPLVGTHFVRLTGVMVVVVVDHITGDARWAAAVTS